MVPGVWNLMRCPSDDCGLVWLNPMPTEIDLPKIYRQYYTHGSRTKKRPASFWESSARAVLKIVYTLVKSRFRLREKRKAINRMFLDPPDSSAELLEVGCGDGTRLHLLKKQGWTVTGQDVDQKAIAHAKRKYGMAVALGPLAEIGFADNRFDAIIMNHVIEHILDPVQLLTECNRILKPGGRIVMTTPNVDSLGHRTFGRCWRGLEPPRHLHLFSPSSAWHVMKKTGFCGVEVSTSAVRATSFAIPSRELAIHGRHVMGQRPQAGVFLKGVLFQYRAMQAFTADPLSGEEVVIQAKGATR